MPDQRRGRRGRSAARSSISSATRRRWATPRTGIFADGVLVVRDGKVAALGPAAAVLPTLPAGAAVTDYRGKLILPGFVDTHVHYAQTDIIASYGAQLLEWLERYTFPAEARFADPEHAREVAEFFVAELLRNGTTTRDGVRDDAPDVGRRDLRGGATRGRCGSSPARC